MEAALPMDFFALPDVFHRALMKKMTIRDRFRLRLTCRAFEELVATTHAGTFGSAHLSESREPNKLKFEIEEGIYNYFDASEEGLNECIKVLNRLYSGIKYQHFCFNHNICLSTEFVLNFTKTCKVERFFLYINTIQQFDMYRQMMRMIPTRRYNMILSFFPGSDQLMALPYIEKLEIRDYSPETEVTIPWPISSELFFHLFDNSRLLIIDNAELTVDDCERAVKAVSVKKKFIRVQMQNSLVVKWLEKRNIYMDCKEGDRYGDAEVINVPKYGRRHEFLKLRITTSTNPLTGSFISIDGAIWEDRNSRSGISLYNITESHFMM